MDDKAKELILRQLDEAIAYYESVSINFVKRGSSKMSERVLVTARSAIENATSPNSPYRRQMNTALSELSRDREAPCALGEIMKALRTALVEGYTSISELIHGEMFIDYLEMSSHLLEEGYKDPAAVITGASLEQHLRLLYQSVGIATEIEKGGKTVPVKAEMMNQELAKEGVISKGDQKQVTAWLDTRNNAAHGHYCKYNAEAVNLLILGVRAVISKYPT